MLEKSRQPAPKRVVRACPQRAMARDEGMLRLVSRVEAFWSGGSFTMEKVDSLTPALVEQDAPPLVS